jgi:hypothetical protein
MHLESRWSHGYQSIDCFVHPLLALLSLVISGSDRLWHGVDVLILAAEHSTSEHLGHVYHMAG